MSNYYPIEMKKLTVMLNDDTEKSLREYVTRNYPTQPFGKLSEVANHAIAHYINDHVVTGRISRWEPTNKLVIDVIEQTENNAGMSFFTGAVFGKYLGKKVRVVIEELD